MKKEKYIVISSYVSHEAKTSVTISPVFNTAIETLLWFKKTKAEASPHSSEKSYSFYEVCNWVSIDSTQMYSKDEYSMELIAKQEASDLFAPAPDVTPAL